jgi:RNA polymerase sigma factor (sigma-70 family)
LYRSANTEAQRLRIARDLYLRFLPLVRKTLYRFCHRFRPSSRCYSGACLPEELLGDSYLAFLKALEEFDPNRGVDFVGYASQRLYWYLEHRARRLEPLRRQLDISDRHDHPTPASDEEERLLDRLLTDDLLARLSLEDRTLLRRYASGYRLAELARENRISEPALRKRLERLRRRLRALIRSRATRAGNQAPSAQR